MAAAAGGTGDEPGALGEPQPPEDIPGVKDFLDRYAAGWDKAAPSFHEEVSKNREVLEHLSAYDMKGGVLRVDGGIAM